MIPDKDTLKQLLAEEEELYLEAFDEQTAWEIGALGREIALKESLPVAVRIVRGEQILFQTGLPGSGPDNDLWLGGKARIVSHFLCSSFYMAEKLRAGNSDIRSKYHLEPAVYRCKGGAVPLRVRNGGIAGILIVSGLKDSEDHRLAVRIIKEYLGKPS